MNDSINPDGRSHKASAWQLTGAAVVIGSLIGLLIAFFNANGIGLPLLDEKNPLPSMDGAPLPSVDGASGRTLPVNTLVAVPTPSYEQVRSYNGIVRARQTSELSFARPARLVRLLVQQGQEVKAGDAVAEQDTSQLSLQKTKLEDARTRADADLARLIGDSQLRSMEAMRIEVRDLQSELSQLREEINNREESADGAATSQQNPRPSPQARLDAAQQRLAVLDATSRDPQVNEQRTVVADLNRQLAELDAAIQKSTLRAPFDGVIAMRHVSEGMMVSPEVAIMRIVERDSLQAWVGVPPDVANDVSEGQTYVIQVGTGSSAEEVEAQVFAKVPELDRSTRTRTVVFSLDPSTSTKTLPGEVARIELRREIESPGFWLPITSLMRASRGLWSIYVATRTSEGDQVVSRRDVEVIYLEGEWARVRGTLDEGDLVVADGTHRVVLGQKVESIRVGWERSP